MIFSNNQIWWIVPYYELHHLHYTNWQLKICIWPLHFSSWLPKGNLRIFSISSPVACDKLGWTNHWLKIIGVQAGGGALQLPQILGNSDFLGSKRKFGQSHFLKTFLCFFFISLKRQIFCILIWKNPEVSIIIQLLSLETLTVVA